MSCLYEPNSLSIFTYKNYSTRYQRSLELRRFTGQVQPNQSTLENKKNQKKLTTYHFQILEKFFEMRVAAPPFRCSSVATFSKILACPMPVLKDLIQIMKCDLVRKLERNIFEEKYFILHDSSSISFYVKKINFFFSNENYFFGELIKYFFKTISVVVIVKYSRVRVASYTNFTTFET